MEHAVKNSLAKIRLHALNIRQGLTAGEYQRVEEYVDRLLVTTDQMLNATRSISRAGRSSLVVKGDWYDLQALVDQAIEPLTALLEMRVVREDRPYRLYLDPRLVTECLSNIFNNSLEALAGKGTVTVSLAETRRYAVLTIRDDGPGKQLPAVIKAAAQNRRSKYGERLRALMLERKRELLQDADRDLLALLAAGHSQQEIAAMAHLSEDAVKKRVSRLRKRFGWQRSTRELAERCRLWGMLEG